MRKQIVALMVVAALVFGMLPFPVSAENIAEGTCGDDLTWVISGGGYLTISGSGDMYDYSEETPPWYEYRDSIRGVHAEGGNNISSGAFRDCVELWDLRVNGPQVIGAYAFSGCTNLQMVDLYTVETIGENAFSGCQFLNMVEGTDQLVSIGDRAFEDCWQLMEFSFSDSLTHIGEAAFRNCRLDELSLGSSVEYIGAEAFAGCAKMGELTIPASVRFIGPGAFSEMHEVTAFAVDPENSCYSNDSDGFLYNKDQTVLLQAPGQINSTYTAPQSLTAVEDKAFYKSWHLPEVVLSDSTEILGESAFEECEQLTKVRFGSNLKTIGAWTFKNCANLSDVILPSEIQSIGVEAFGDCAGMKRLVFTGDAPMIADEALLGVCTTAYYPEENTSWTEEVLSDYGGAITWVPVQSCSEAGHHYEVTVFDPTCVSDGYTEYFCTSCGDRYEDSRLPALGHDFDDKGCTRCDVTFLSQGSCGTGAYYRHTSDGVLTIYGSGYVSDSPWSGGRVRTLIIEEGITQIKYYLFRDYRSLEYVSLPGSLESTPWNGFWGCDSLTQVILGEGIQSIGETSFRACSALKEIRIPDSVTSIDNSAFWECSSLEHIDLGEGLVSIGDSVFSGCTALEEIRFPDTLETIGGSVFYNCEKLRSIEVAPDNKVFSSNGNGCLFNKEMTELVYVPLGASGDVVIPDSVTSIMNDACHGRPYITSVYIGEGVTTVGDRAFQGCDSLVYVEFGSNVEKIGGLALADCPNIKAVRFTGNALASSVSSLFSQYYRVMVFYPGGNETWEDVESTQYITLIPEYSCPEHHFDAAVTAPTCTAMGFTTYLCSSCEYSYQDNFINALTHSYEGNTCVNCGYVKEVIGSGSGGDHITWEMTSDGTITFSGRGTLSSVPASRRTEIKHVVIESGITKFAWSCFSNCSNMTNIVLPDSVTELGQHTFAGCSSIVSMILPPKIKKLERELFNGCTNLKSIVIPEEVKTIEPGVFFRCHNLSNVVFPGGLTRIENVAFKECFSLEKLDLPGSITYIGQNAFDTCVSLERVQFDGRMPEMDETAFAGCITTIAYHGSDCSWTDIAGAQLGATALEWENLDETVGTHIPEICPRLDPTCTESGYEEYEFCTDCGHILSAYTELTPLGHNYEETRTEPRCRAEGSIHGDCIRCDETFDTVIPETGHTYETEDPNACCIICGTPANCVVDGNCGVDAFWYLLEDGTLIIDGSGPMLKDDDMRNIPTKDVESVVIGDGITYIPSYTFRNYNKLKSVTIGAGVEGIAARAFYECTSLEAFVVSEDNSVYSSGDDGILYSKDKTILEHVPMKYSGECHVPDGVEKIANFAFEDCAELTAVYIPASVTSIPSNPFAGCSNLAGIYVDADNQKYSSIDGCLICFGYSLNYVPEGRSGDYVMPDGISSISYYAFENCTALTSITIGKEMHDFYDVSFKGCSSLRAFYVDPDNWFFAADNSGCLYDREMETLYRAPCAITGEYTVPEGITCITVNAFEDCKYLHILNIPASVTEIEGVDWRESEERTFSGCDSLSEINVHPDNLSYRSINGCLYEYNFLLYTPKNLHGDCQIPEGTTEIGQSAFNGRTALSSVTIPASVTSVGEAAFADCTGMSEIIFLGSAPVFASTETSTDSGSDVFSNVTATAYRPLEDQSWTVENMVDYGGTITWVAYKAGETPWLDNDEPAEPDVPVNPFADVPNGEFFYDPVMWAVENEITNGTSATTFSPSDQCMRAHVVTFLWRAMGCPEPTKTDNPFVDVKPSDFYYKPVLWALENGITAGMDATHFGPTAYCNRAQVVTFLYRTMGSPAVESTSNPFTDVPVGQWYTAPVLWAVRNGITNGQSATTFGPNAICNRAQIVTFLYRAFKD